MPLAPTVAFWFILIFSDGNHPIDFIESAKDLLTCEEKARRFLREPPRELIRRGGSLRAGCQVKFAGSQPL